MAMGQVQTHSSTKMANQAWRKKPRQFAPKSRLGCRTCKIRRVKCDLSRPSCLNCQRTGRTCDGYNELPLGSEAEVHSSYYNFKQNVNRAKSRERDHSCGISDTYQPNQWEWRAEVNHSLSLRNPGPFMILPMTSPALSQAMSFFEYTSVKHLNKYQPCDESWRKTLMFFSQTVLSVRHAAIALALLHRQYIESDADFRDHVRGNQPPPSKPWRLLDKKAPLFHYTLAIQHLLSQGPTCPDIAERTAITLLVCYLFTCFDHLAGDDVQATKHLRGGVELSRSLDRVKLNNNNSNDHDHDTGNDINSLEVRKLACQVTSQIHRLDMQAGIFLVDWTPADAQEIITYQLKPSDSAFESLDQAANNMQMLVARVMGLHNTEQQRSAMGKAPPPPSNSCSKDILLCQLQTWSSLFEGMLQSQQVSSSAHGMGSESGALITLLRLQRTITWILLNSQGPGREMEYDFFLPQFQECVALARDVTVAHERYSGSLKPTFTPEIGILPALYIIGAKCRHTLVRRQVLDILRRQWIREAAWDSICITKIIERVIMIEEGGCKEGIIPQSMDQIAVWQRIEVLSWIHVANGQSAPRLDISYTLCTREGICTESILI